MATSKTDLTYALLELKQSCLLRATELSNMLFCIYSDFHSNIYLVVDVPVNPNVAFLSNPTANEQHPSLLHLKITFISHFVLSLCRPPCPVWKVLILYAAWKWFS